MIMIFSVDKYSYFKNYSQRQIPIKVVQKVLKEKVKWAKKAVKNFRFVAKEVWK